MLDLAINPKRPMCPELFDTLFQVSHKVKWRAGDLALDEALKKLVKVRVPYSHVYAAKDHAGRRALLYGTETGTVVVHQVAVVPDLQYQIVTP